jgi:cell division ATPase FtsA
MTLRDYFAAKAMQGQLSIRENLIALAREQIKIEDVCLDSYAVADAMLKAREE